MSDKIQLIKNTFYEDDYDATVVDKATRCDVMTEEVLVPVVGAPTTGGAFDRFPQSSGTARLVSTPLWSLRPFMCPLWAASWSCQCSSGQDKKKSKVERGSATQMDGTW